MILKKKLQLLLIILLFASCKSDSSKAFVPESNGNINTLTVVMDKSAWGNSLGKQIKKTLTEPYEGLPFDEPKYDLYHLEPSIFTGFARSSRNIIVFNKDTTGQGFRVIKNLWARPQITAIITGEDEEVMSFYFEENKDLLMRTIDENERIEKIRRMSISPNKDKELKENIECLCEACQKGYMTHPTRKTKIMFGKRYRNCVKKEGADTTVTLEQAGMIADNICVNCGSFTNENLRKWFNQRWVNIGKKKKGGGHPACGTSGKKRGYAKCVPASKAARMSDKEKASATRRKRAAQNKKGRGGTSSLKGGGKKPIYVSTKPKK